jgi:hypothetical protein
MAQGGGGSGDWRIDDEAKGVMNWTEMTPLGRFDTAAQTVMAAGREGEKLELDATSVWRDAADATG